MDAISQRHQQSMNTTVEESSYTSDAVVTFGQGHHLVSSVAVACCKLLQLIQFILTIESFNSAAQCFSNGCHFAKSCLLVEGLCGIVLVTAKGLGVLTAHIKSFVSHVPENDMLLSTGNSQSALQPTCVLGVRNAGRR